ncbi:MAG: type IX secretion system membrane protein PorP/SprF [Saprospiraceae bacterium]|nr:type IX secretion system membrane protein PorP/SprF [Saprospiraceae bacterium]MCF8248947.1 type IX secretion system membrane protein PorP/SprF [Saprospiraceae bacterium]MCF8279158.1 type IX secretion system membrane protein PorP/SprF [Bacteroidales bacterium]MCF8310841.1 type IX secretion system membrane protein PorP/SprF [Saprospiraceae bacterium]MCF8439571.1 type IX secretion system membrane protein PorP/SprF [Saprospiraceae bacterium]
MRYLYLLFLFFGTSLSAQQVPIFSQLFYNKIISNPGAAGSTGLPSFTAFHRQQWVGLEGAPVTDALSFNSPLLAGRVGIGLTIANEQIGFFNSTSAQLAYAYRVPMAGGSLGIGLHGSMNRYEADLSEVRTISGSLGSTEGMMDLNYAYNLGMGAHFENERFFVGVAVPQVLDRGQANGQVRHIFANAGAVLELSPKLRMRSAGAVRLVKNAPPSMDFYLGFGFTKEARLWLGSTLRMSHTTTGLGGDALVALGQYQIAERLRAGLAYDMGLGPVRSGNAGGFELMLEYCFIKAAVPAQVLRPRYF